ncbi:MAG: bifunctional phosphopantothenoylcysteine decarboxylase/phosphopantothenate--cysteine ligase CoaBC [Chloroflexota bacterium]|nr:bifunctional phosphopantothenoylcysteine decarboxylase/phosphopantothenate--cysteine ligase CoaBC [Chloroflexota bacterium]
MRQTDGFVVPPSLLQGKRVMFGVTGGIAAYKAADLVSWLVQQGAQVRVTMTKAATEFVAPMTFEAITRQPVYTDVFDGWGGDEAGHVTLASMADAVLVAPATANAIAEMAHGFTGDMLGAVLLSTTAPIVVAPAMEHHMWHHPATQANVRLLKERGVTIVAPERGHLASGASGDGRLASRETIVAGLRSVLARSGPLSGRTIVVTAGGTHEAIDPVRFIGNRSSGQMGVAMAEAAYDAGAAVRTVFGPTVVTPSITGHVERVESALEMAEAVERATAGAHALIMAAAVADFRPATAAESKIKKGPGDDAPTVPLVRNPDILASLDRPGLLKIGFAAETHDLIANATEKLRRKGLAMIVANDAVASIGAGESQATLLHGDGRMESLPVLPKAELARVIVGRVVALLAKERDHA